MCAHSRSLSHIVCSISSVCAHSHFLSCIVIMWEKINNFCNGSWFVMQHILNVSACFQCFCSQCFSRSQCFGLFICNICHVPIIFEHVANCNCICGSALDVHHICQQVVQLTLLSPCMFLCFVVLIVPIEKGVKLWSYPPHTQAVVPFIIHHLHLIDQDLWSSWH